MGHGRGGWILIGVLLVGAAQAGEEWPQWGGTDRNFTVEARGLSQSWGDDGPSQLWSRSLGGGFASIVSDGKRLYTAYRDGDDEIVIALNPKNGKTVWEHRYAAPIVESDSLSTQYGKGPNATPLLIDGKIVTLGFTGHVRCLDTAKGKLRWSHDLEKDFEVSTPYFGHAPSPLAVGGNAVIVAGGVHAFDLDSGKPVWQNRDFEGNYGSPHLWQANGASQVVTPVDGRVAGIDTKTGKTIWSHEFKNQWGTILTSPVADDAGRIFISAAQIGSILIDPSAAKADERLVWKADQTTINHSNAVRAGKWVFASSGDTVEFLTATSMEDGTQAWKERGFGQANLLRVGDEFLLLDFEGKLALVNLNAKGMKIVTQASIAEEPTWTPPTLLGTTLYVRDQSKLMALDLSTTAAK